LGVEKRAQKVGRPSPLRMPSTFVCSDVHACFFQVARTEKFVRGDAVRREHVRAEMLALKLYFSGLVNKQALKRRGVVFLVVFFSLVLIALLDWRNGASFLAQERPAGRHEGDSVEFDERMCRAINSTTKWSSSCAPKFQAEKLVPLLIAAVGGSGTKSLAYLYKYNGLKVRHEAVGEEGTVGWWQLFNLNQLRTWEQLESTAKKLSQKLGNREIAMTNTVNEVQANCLKGGIKVQTASSPYTKPCHKAGERKSMPYFPQVSEHPYRYVKVVHQVRDPLKVISSYARFCGHKQIWRMVWGYTPKLKELYEEDIKYSTVQRSHHPTCTKMMMYHWLSWNMLIEPYSDWTYRVEDHTPHSICVQGFQGFPDIQAKCEHEAILDPKKSIRQVMNSKAHAGRKNVTPKMLIELDCELALQIFKLATRYGYSQYENFTSSTIACKTM
jgi:hypothetical protein